MSKTKEQIALLKTAAEERVTSVQTHLDAAKAEFQSFQELEANLNADLKAEHDAGFDEGLAQVSAPGDKTLSIEEYNADLAKALAPKDEEIASLKTKVSELEAIPPVDTAPLQAQIATLVSERDGLRAAIKAEVDDSKSDTSRLEAAIAPIEVAPVPEVPAPAAE